MRGLGRWAAVAVGLLVAACGDGEGDTSSGAGAGGSGSTSASTSGTGGGSTNGSGGGSASSSSGSGGGSGTCPLDALARQRVEAVAQPAMNVPFWIIANTKGHGMFAGRGFGVVVPFTQHAILYSASLMEACTGPKTFDPYCEMGDPGAPSPVERCSQLVCNADGMLSAKVWVNGVPDTIPAEPPPGDVTVKLVEHTTSYQETGADGVAIDWDGVVDLTLPDGSPVKWIAAGMGDVGGGMNPSSVVTDVIEGVAAQPVTIDAEVTLSDTNGQVKYEGVVVATIDHEGVKWIGDCGP